MQNVELMQKPENIYSDGGKSVLNIRDYSYFDAEQYDLCDEKEFSLYIKDLERLVRQSFEYRWLISYLKRSEGMDQCSFLENVSSRDNTKVKIEIHHSPLTLFDICLAVFRKRQANGEDLNINNVAYEVMWLHYIGWVGLIPLSATVHELVHNNYIFIPTDKVRGNYQQFINTYYNYIDPEVLDCIDNAEQATKEYKGEQMEIFNNHKLYVRKPEEALENRPVMQQNIKNRINAIKGDLKVMCTIVKK